MEKYEYSRTISHDMAFDYFLFEVSDKAQFSIDIIKEKALILSDLTTPKKILLSSFVPIFPVK